MTKEFHWISPGLSKKDAKGLSRGAWAWRDTNLGDNCTVAKGSPFLSRFSQAAMQQMMSSLAEASSCLTIISSVSRCRVSVPVQSGDLTFVLLAFLRKPRDNFFLVSLKTLAKAFLISYIFL
jgi:hypothetical protein